MRPYATQMEAARMGVITPEMETMARKEFRTWSSMNKALSGECIDIL